MGSQNYFESIFGDAFKFLFLITLMFGNKILAVKIIIFPHRFKDTQSKYDNENVPASNHFFSWEESSLNLKQLSKMKDFMHILTEFRKHIFSCYHCFVALLINVLIFHFILQFALFKNWFFLGKKVRDGIILTTYLGSRRLNLQSLHIFLQKGKKKFFFFSRPLSFS